MDWNEVLSVVVKFVVIPILPLVTAYICAYIKNGITKLQIETDNEMVDKYLEIAETTLVDAVITVTETYVKALKENGEFDLQAQQVAMQKTIDMFNSIITEDCKEVLGEVYEDYNAWIHSRIESIIAATK